jgi:hypothetical protein
MQPSTSAAPSIISTQIDATNATPCNTFQGAPPPAAEAQPPSDHALAKCDTAENPPEAHSPLPVAPDARPQSQIAIPKPQTDETNPFTLSDRQRLALEMILAGLPDAAVGKQLGLSRTTIYRWRHFNCAFLAELNRRRLDTWNASHEKLRALLPRALAALAAALKSDDLSARLRSAKTVLAHVSPDPDALKPPQRQLDPDEVLSAYIYANRDRKKGNPYYDKPITDKERDEARQFLQHQLRPDEQAARHE